MFKAFLVTRECRYHHCDRITWVVYVFFQSFIVNHASLNEDADGEKQNKNKRITLDDCIQLYLQQERLTADNQWYKCCCGRSVGSIFQSKVLPTLQKVESSNEKTRFVAVARDTNYTSEEIPIH